MSDAAFGDLLREFRCAAGLSQEALAERARLSPGAISTLERSARRAPQMTTLSLIVEALALGAADRARLERAAAVGRHRGPREASIAEQPIPNNLRSIPTSFRGREAELAALDAVIESRRIVTLLGTGGVGKTRLALEAGRAHLAHERFPDGLWFVDLAPLGTPDLVGTAIARLLQIREQPGIEIVETIAHALAARRLLLILDNCEHVVDECALLVERIVRECPGVTVLATTREALRIEGECVVRVEPLRVERERASGPALELFLDRLADADYARFSELTPLELARAAVICRRLDGIPLALELAAGRARDLSLAHISEGLDERFALLAAGRRTASPRESTLRGMIEWSYLPLTPHERETFARLGIFAGAFAPEAAAVVVGDGAGAVRAALVSLIAKSLVVVVEDLEGRPRYRLLETMREYARERSHATADHARVAARFATYYTSRAREADARYGRISNADFLALVEPDLDNYRAALEWTLGEGNELLLGAELAGAMGWIYRQTTLFAEGMRWVEAALANRDALAPDIVARLHMAKSFFAYNVGELQRAFEAADAATAAYRRADSKSGLAWSLTQEAYCCYVLGRHDSARLAAAEAVVHARECGDTFRLAGALNAIAVTTPIERAAERFAPLEEAIRCYRASGDEGAIVPLSILAETKYAVGDFAGALASGVNLVAQARTSRDRSNLAGALANTAAYALTAGDDVSADAYAREALTLVRDLGKTLHAMTVLQHRATIVLRSGGFERAARLLGASNALYAAFGLEREHTERSLYDATIAGIREGLGEPEASRALACGAAAALDDTIAEALAPD